MENQEELKLFELPIIIIPKTEKGIDELNKKLEQIRIEGIKKEMEK